MLLHRPNDCKVRFDDPKKLTSCFLDPWWGKSEQQQLEKKEGEEEEEEEEESIPLRRILLGV